MLRNEKLSPLLKLKDVNISFGERKILEKINLEIYKGERIGLVGYNGCGKTTLANLIFGNLQPDSGTITQDNSCNFGYLMQATHYHVDNTLLSNEFAEDQSIFQISSRLGLSKLQFWNEERLRHLSGGERLKVALTELWTSKPDLLILDEPTNHLDHKGTLWLLKEIKGFKGPILIISHDRHFLDNCVTKIIEIEDCALKEYSGNYSDYQKQKKENHEAQLHQYEVQQRKKTEIENQMDRLKRWSVSAHIQSTKQGSRSERRQIGYKEYHRVKAKKMDNQVKSKLKRLQQELEKNGIEKPKQSNVISFEFDTLSNRGSRIIDASSISKQFGEETIFKSSSFFVKRGEKIGVIGDNGCGKSTLLKIILGLQQPDLGEIWVSESVKAAYLSQDVLDLPEKLTVSEVLGLTDKEQIQLSRTMMANMGLTADFINKKIGQLSLGERTKIKFIDLLLKNYDFLILDEPTNHLDLPSREQLEATLSEFRGTLLIVSHDHYLIDKVCDHLLTFEKSLIKRHEMGLSEYRKRQEAMKTISINENHEKRLLIENRISAILGELSTLDRKNEKFEILDQEYKALLEEKKKVF